jgi:hypothetical protein
MIPDMTTGMSDCRSKLVSLSVSRPQAGHGVRWFAPVALLFSHRTFIIKSGLKVPTPAIPIPDFAVP